MAETTKARKKPVRTAPQRKDFDSEVAWLQAKLNAAQDAEHEADAKRVDRINTRIASVQTQIAALNNKLSLLQAERDKLTPESWSQAPLDEV